MKCTRCGKNEANVFYRTNINGKITEERLCSECATNSEYENDIFDQFREVEREFNSFFDGFFGSPALPFGGLSTFGGFRMPTMLMPRIHVLVNNGTSTEEKKEEEVEKKADPELSQRREVNMLKEQMKAAIEAEEFEKAAEIRDKLRAMENKE